MKIAREGDTVLELGGGIGYISTLIGAHRPVRHEIHTFEANPRLIDYIHLGPPSEQCQKRHRPQRASWPRERQTPRFLLSGRISFPPRSTITPARTGRHRFGRTDRGARHQHHLRTRSQPDVLICDIEGGEADLLPALRYDGLRAAVIELHPQWIGAEGVRAVFEAMHRAGLAYYPRWSHRKVVVFRREW